MQWPAADIHRVIDQVRVPLHVIAGGCADDSAEQNQKRNEAATFPERLRQSFNWERSEAVHFAVAARVGRFRCPNKIAVHFEFRRQSENILRAHVLIALGDPLVWRDRRAR